MDPTHARVALVCRAEPALRAIRAVRELNAERGWRLRTVALFTDEDRDSLHAREADEAVGTGGGLDPADLERALPAARPDLVWAGWRPAAEQAAVAELCARRGWGFVGADAALLGRLADPRTAESLATELGLQAAPSPRPGAAEAVYSVLVAADADGTVWPLGVVEAGPDGGEAAVVAESPPRPHPSAGIDALLGTGLAVCRRLGLVGVATVEFRRHPGSEHPWLSAVLPGPPAQHSVCDAVTGVDAVKLALALALGERLSGSTPEPTGWAMAATVGATDDRRDLDDGPRRIDLLRTPTGAGVRVDVALAEGDVVPASAVVARVTGWGRSRAEAYARLRRALADCVLVTSTGLGDRARVLGMLRAGQPAPAGGAPRDADAAQVAARHGAVALLDTAVEQYEADMAAVRARFIASAARGRPQVSRQVGRQVTCRRAGHAYRMTVYRDGAASYQVEVDGRRYGLAVQRLGAFERRLTCLGGRFRVLGMRRGLDRLIDVEGVPERVALDRSQFVRATAPGVVLTVPVAPSDLVAAGSTLAVLESMKMEVAVNAPFAGRVGRVFATSGVQVQPGTPLLLLEPAGAADDTAPEPGGRLRFDGARAATPSAPALLLRLILGFDVDPAEVRRLFGEYAARGPDPDLDRARALLDEEDACLRAFADLCSLFRRRVGARDIDADDGGEQARSEREHLLTYLRSFDPRASELPPAFLRKLRTAVGHYGIHSLERTPELEEALLRIFRSQEHVQQQLEPVRLILDARAARAETLRPTASREFREVIDRLVAVTRSRFPELGDLAREVQYRYFGQALFEQARQRLEREAAADLAALEHDPGATEPGATESDGSQWQHVERLVECPLPLEPFLAARIPGASPRLLELTVEVLTRRYYRIRRLDVVSTALVDGQAIAVAAYEHEATRYHVLATHAEWDRLPAALGALGPVLAKVPEGDEALVDVYVWRPTSDAPGDAVEAEVRQALEATAWPRRPHRVTVGVTSAQAGRHATAHTRFTYRPGEDGYAEDRRYRGLHPMIAERIGLGRLRHFTIERLPSVEEIYLFRGVAVGNPREERLFALAEVRDLSVVRDQQGWLVLPQFERVFLEAVAAIRTLQARRPAAKRPYGNQILLLVWPPLPFGAEEMAAVAKRLAPATYGLGLERVLLHARIPDPATAGGMREVVVHLSNPTGAGVVVSVTGADDEPLQPLSEYEQRVVRMRRRGFVYPYEIVRMLTPAGEDPATGFPPGDFAEHDLDDQGDLVPVQRPYGGNQANLVVGVLRNRTAKHPEGLSRVVLLGDPSRNVGAISEPECRRVIAALDLAQRMGVPLEWYAASSGAKIAMDSGSETMDWVSRTLRRLAAFTATGGEVNVVVNAINAGGQPYWNAASTMTPHSRGILIMTSNGAMVLTGKQSLEFAGGVAAEDNFGIGGYERIMGPNGEAQYWAPDLVSACHLLLRHYEHTYVAPGEHAPRRAVTADPFERDVCASPHPPGHGSDFRTVGEIFSAGRNPDRKKPFDIRAVMRAVSDADQEPLERWAAMQDAEIAVVWDAHLGGYPVCLLGIESHAIPRRGLVPADGPAQWTSGTLYPESARKLARAVNAASGNRPVVLLANLSGSDGSPESMRRRQLEMGAELAGAVMRFDGPLVVCIISRMHGGSFVVFSGQLNPQVEIAAVEGSYTSVIGGGSAAAVVFGRDVDARTAADPRVRALDERLASADRAEEVRLRARRSEVYRSVHAEKTAEVADEFTAVHSVERARRVGSIHRIIPASRLRPYLIDAVERGLARRGAPPSE